MNSTRSIMEGCMCGGYIIIKHKLLGWTSNLAREIYPRTKTSSPTVAKGDVRMPQRVSAGYERY